MQLRRQLLRSIALGGALAPWWMQDLVRQAAAGQGGIRGYRGSVTLNGQSVRFGMPVSAGDSLRTGPDAEVIYTMGGNAFLQRGDSHVAFGSGVSTGLMRVVTGRLLSVFARGEQRIATATATIGIRGTGCYIEAGETDTYFCLCYGEAQVTPIADPAHAQRIISRHHDRPLMIGRAAGAAMLAPSRVVNHRDAELRLIESLVGRVPPFDQDVEGGAQGRPY